MSTAVFFKYISIDMADNYVWYECYYPEAPSTFYTNVITGSVCTEVPLDDPDIAHIKSLGIETNFSKSVFFYISLLFEFDFFPL